MHIAMPGYIDRTLTRLGVSKRDRPTHSPVHGLHTSHVRPRGPQITQPDDSASASLEDKRTLQQASGILFGFGDVHEWQGIPRTGPKAK